MTKLWKLKRTKQCEKCPWRKDVDPNEIPDGYSHERHRALASTIAEPADLCGLSAPLKIMGCHESPADEEVHCIGWLVNQVGPGNNIGLRMSMMGCQNAPEVEVVGEQHETFEDTLPEGVMSDRHDQ